MRRSSIVGIFSIVLLSVAFSLNSPSAYAEGVEVTSIALDETTIIEMVNGSEMDVNMFRVWLGADEAFESFKTEDGWTGERTPQGVIVFTASDPVGPGESVKFGIMTDRIVQGINWKALDGNAELNIGIAVPEELVPIPEETPADPEPPIVDLPPVMTPESSFRIIPEKPNVGSTIRVIGDEFGASQSFDFYINTEKIGSFVTDENGHFITTIRIPDDQEAERVDLKIKSVEGDERKISLRIGESKDRIAGPDIKLTIMGIPNVIHRGDVLMIHGTGQPGGAITGKITNPEGEILNARTAEIDSRGDWDLEPITMPLNTPFGRYTATITDGKESLQTEWSVESNKNILIAPKKLKYDPGDTMIFNGTVRPNIPIEVIIEDPPGKEIFSDTIEVSDAESVQFEFVTTQDMIDGTYTVIVTQEGEKEFIFVGLGELPSVPINMEFDKLNYKAGEMAEISLIGMSSEIVSLLIVDSSDIPVDNATAITIKPDGRGTHILDLEDYASGLYTAIISRGSAQSTEKFTVGLQPGSGEIKISATKTDYQPGDSILIIGELKPEVLLIITLIDPDGNEVRVNNQAFSDENGKVTDNTFRIPSDGTPGTWKINAKSGSSFNNYEFNVLAPVTDELLIFITERIPMSGHDQGINIRIVGAERAVEMEIVADDGEIIDELKGRASAQGEVEIPWIFPDDADPGTYTLKVNDGSSSAETTFDIP